jgi:hypothetical protein
MGPPFFWAAAPDKALIGQISDSRRSSVANLFRQYKKGSTGTYLAEGKKGTS